MDYVRFILCAICMFLGVFTIFVGVLGTYKFKFVLNRMHSAALLDTCGLFFIVIGCAIAKNFDATTIKLLLIFIVLWLTSPVSSHMIAKLEFETDESIPDEVENKIEDIKGDEKDEY